MNIILDYYPIFIKKKYNNFEIIFLIYLLDKMEYLFWIIYSFYGLII